MENKPQKENHEAKHVAKPFLLSQTMSLEAGQRRQAGVKRQGMSPGQNGGHGFSLVRRRRARRGSASEAVLLSRFLFREPSTRHLFGSYSP